MTSTDQGVAAPHPRQPFALGAVIDGAKRAAKQHPVLIAAAVVVLWGGGVAGGVAALNSLSAFQAAAVCPAASAYVYEVPGYPAQVPSAPAWPPGKAYGWGWMPRRHALKVGNRLRLSGRLWQVSAIAALPRDCKFFGVSGHASPPGGTLAGRLVLRPVG
jgi:hypothetical protein